MTNTPKKSSSQLVVEAMLAKADKLEDQANDFRNKAQKACEHPETFVSGGFVNTEYCSICDTPLRTF